MSEIADDSEHDELEESGFHEQYIDPASVISNYDTTLAQSRWRASFNAEQAPVLLIAFNTFANGLVGLIEPLFQRLSQHPRFYDIVVPYGVYHWSRALSLFFGFTLVLLSLNLVQRKKMSWLLSCIGLSVSLLVHVLRARIEYRSDSDFVNETIGFAFLPIILNLLLLIFYRKRFSVKSEKRKIKTGVLFLLISLLIALAYGTLGFFLLDKRDFGVDFQLHDALVRTVREFLLIGNPDIQAQTSHAVWFLDSLRLSGLIAGVFAAYSLFRPIEYELRSRPVEKKLACEILDASGANALDYYKLLPDKSYIFSASRNCFVAYKTVLGIAVALGDVVGKAEELPEFLKAYLAWCHENAWSVAFMQTGESLLPLYRQNALQVLKVGEDAVVDLNKFVSETSKKKDFKNRVKKFEKDSYGFKCFDAPQSLDLLTQLEEVSNEWLSLPGRRERGFSLGMFDRNTLKHDTIFAVVDSQQKIIAFVNQVRSYAAHEVSIDLMRHRREVSNGTMDYLFVKLLFALHEKGFEKFNLGLAALSGVGEKAEDSVYEKAVHLIYEHLNRFFSYNGTSFLTTCRFRAKTAATGWNVINVD